MSLTSDDLTPNISKVALIFEGGGMRAAYTSAMAVALLEADMHFGFVAGVSAGSSNTANYVSRDPVRARRSFVEFATDKNFGSLASWLRGDGMFNAHYIYERTSRVGGALPYDFKTWITSPTEVALGGFEMETGQTVYWNKANTSTPAKLMRRVRASSTMPVLMPPVEIDGKMYVDGALGTDAGIPISEARAHGFEKFVIIMTREAEYFKKPERFPMFYRRVFKKYPAVAEALLSRWHRYNDTKEHLLALRDAGQAYLFIPETMPVENNERDLRKLRATHQMGLAQARAEIPAIREFVGLPNG